MTKNKNKSRNQSLEGLRGYMCIGIVLFHYTVQFPMLMNKNDIWAWKYTPGAGLGVLGFWLLSGFFILPSLSKLLSIRQIWGVLEKT